MIRGILVATLLTLTPLNPSSDTQNLQPEDPLNMLRDIICREETAGHPAPAWATNNYSQAWGECQIKYHSAIAYSSFDPQMHRTGVPSRSPGDLFISATSRKVAREILDTCSVRQHKATGRSLAYCYCAGPNRRSRVLQECRTYSKRVGLKHAAWDFQQQLTAEAYREARRPSRLVKMWHMWAYSDNE